MTPATRLALGRRLCSLSLSDGESFQFTAPSGTPDPLVGVDALGPLHLAVEAWGGGLGVGVSDPGGDCGGRYVKSSPESMPLGGPPCRWTTTIALISRTRAGASS
jgi:hypothetical protein